MADVFLSYQKRDRDLAERMAIALRAEGLSVWWDDDLTPRESWDRTIEREIAAAERVLVLWTKNSVDSDWVRIEANYARNCVPSKLVQVRFDQTSIPIAFSLTQYVELDPHRWEVGSAWARLTSWLLPEDRPTGTGAAPPPALVHIPVESATGADNLTLMKGVGPRLADRLNWLGFTRFSQIAELTPLGVSDLDSKLGDFQGRINRDRWVEQATLLASGNIAEYESRFGK